MLTLILIAVAAFMTVLSYWQKVQGYGVVGAFVWMLVPFLGDVEFSVELVVVFEMIGLILLWGSATAGRR